jgi:hypothetical protein
MRSIFTKTDKEEGKIGFGKIPQSLSYTTNKIANDYYNYIPDKSLTTYHTWYKDLPNNIKKNFEIIRDNSFWKGLCNKNSKIISITDMDELYYSNPPKNLNKTNLYGASGNFNIHKDGIFNFKGASLYRVLIGLTDGNTNTLTYFNNFNTGYKINKNDYIIFDFDRTTHQVIKQNNENIPRIILKLHFLVYDNSHSEQYINIIKQLYTNFEYITRNFMDKGTNPETYYEFFIGLFCQYYCSPRFSMSLILIILVTTILVTLRFNKKINKNINKIIIYTITSIIILYSIIVFFYWLRFRLFDIK